MRAAPRAALSSSALALYRLLRLVRPRNSVRILYYHSVSDAPIRSSVSPPLFESQMEYLRRGRFRPLSLSEATQHILSRTPFPEKSVVITLDDGFRDNYEHAFPILKQCDFKATVFLTASYIGTDQLPTLTRSDFVPQPLDWAQVREMHAHGIEFGSHTLTHPLLSRITPEQARCEIRESRRLIEQKLGGPVRLFCYPRGDFNDAVRQMVRDEGYLAACTTLPGVNDAATDLFTLRRTYVSRRDTLNEFAKKVAGGYDLLQEALNLWRRLRRRA